MLPPNPPVPSHGDFDPATYQPPDDGMEVDEEEATYELSSTEINILIYLYLLESNLPHTAFSLLSESQLPQTSLFQYFNPSYPSPSAASGKSKVNGTPGTGKSPRDGLFGNPEGKIPRGELIRKLWKALRWEEVERHVTASGQPYSPQCPNPFHLLIPHICPPGYPSATGNTKTPLPPSFRVSPPPSRTSEPFPADSNDLPAAGPSSSRSSRDKSNGAGAGEGKGKRKSRRNSTESSSRNPSPSRGASPARDRRNDTQTKRAKLDEIVDKSAKSSKGKEKADDAMSVDSEPRRKARVSNGRLDSPAAKSKETNSSRLGVDDDRRRSKSPLRRQGKNQAEEEEEDDEQDDETEAEDREEREKAEKKVKEEELRDIEDERKNRPGWIGEERVRSFREHRDFVSTVAWNPKNTEVLATGSGDGTARLWDFKPQQGESKPVDTVKKPFVISHKSIESSRKAVTAVAWHPDGTVLATGSHDGTGRLFTPSGQLQGIMTYGRGAISALKFSPSGHHILTAKTDYTVSLWAVGSSNDQRMLRTFSSHTAEVNDVEWLDDNVFASCGNDKKIFVYRTNDKISRFTFGGHSDDITRLKWQPARAGLAVEDRMLASASDDGTIRLWLLPRYPKDRGTVSRSVSPTKPNEDDEDDNAFDWEENGVNGDKGKRRCVRTLVVVDESENKRMDTVEWSPNGEYIAAGGQDTTVKLFNAATGECVRSLSGLEEGIGSISFSPLANGLIAGGGWFGKIIIWEVETGKLVAQHEIDEDVGKQQTRDKPMNLSMAWRSDGNQLAVGLANKSVLVVHTAGLGPSAFA